MINFNSLAQSSLENQFKYANSLFDEEKYFDAITEFKRLQFFDSLGQYSYISNKMIALCYKEGGKFSEAINYFSKAELNAPNINESFNIKIEVIKVNLLRGTVFRAFDLLDDLEKDKHFYHKKNEITYWRGWAYIFNDEWEEASHQFAQLDENHRLKKLCENVSESQYSRTKAKLLSIFLPGAGQFYTGNYISGILSFSWVALWTYISIDAFIANRIFDGFAVVSFLDLRFYNGNLQNSEKFVEEHNSEISNWMLNYLQNNFKGKKP
jgi:tetratricopeptide (TPR) repeat protein